MFFKKKVQIPPEPFDPKTQVAVLRCSICTGEQVAGFKSRTDGHFKGVRVIRCQKDLEEFLKEYGLSSIQKEY